MKIPKTIKCGGIDYQVIEDDNIAEVGDCMGATQHETQKVFLKSSQAIESKEKTLLHEILHIALYQSGITNRLDRLDKDLEEDIVSSLEHTLYQILKDNKFI